MDNSRILVEQIFKKYGYIYLCVLCLTVFFLIILKTAWVGEDAYITFRTIDNFVHGYGLRWNIAERVQSYTHPLWLFLLTPIYWLAGEIYFSVLTVSIILSLLTLWLLMYTASSKWLGVIGALVLINSKAFTDYSTSGLENPLTHLLMVIGTLIYLRPSNLVRVFWLSLIAALAFLSHPDTILLFGPMVAYYTFTTKQWKSLAAVSLGCIPAIVWEIFSLLYYGSLVPNTAYAKLAHGIPGLELLRQGVIYLEDSLNVDPLTLIFTALAMTALIFTRQWRQLPIVIGILLYLAYVTKIGGDFMSGRLLTTPLLAATVAFTTSKIRLSRRESSLILMLIILLTSLSFIQKNIQSASQTITHYIRHGIADERRYYFEAAGLLHVWRHGGPTHPWAYQGLARRDAASPKIVVRKNIGYFGYYAGPQTHVVDVFALADAFLARLPSGKNDTDQYTKKPWRIGHFPRDLPPGYIETLSTNQNVIQNPQLAAYYDKISLVIRGPLFSWPRLKAIPTTAGFGWDK